MNAERIPDIVMNKLFNDIAVMVSERLANFRDNKWVFSDDGYGNTVFLVSGKKPYPETALTIHLRKSGDSK